MATKTLRRRLATTFSFVVTMVSILCLNLTIAMATPVLVDGNGDIKLGTNEGNASGTVDIAGTSNNILGNLKFWLNGCTGIVLITLTLAFVIKCFQLGTSADNAQKRGNHMVGLIWTAVCIAGLGAFNIVMTILTSLANGF